MRCLKSSFRGEGDDSMGISSVTPTGSMPAAQMTSTNLKDQKSKSIQSEISSAQQQMKKLSSDENLSAGEKANERKKLQKEIADLNTKLKQHQEELQRSQKRERTMAQLLEEAAPAKEEKAEDEMRSDKSTADAADKKVRPVDGQPASRQETAPTENNDGRVILKGVSQPDPNRGTDTETRQADETKEETADVKAVAASDNDTAADDTQSDKELHAMVSADSFLQQADRQGTVVARTRDGIAVLKGEIKLDELRDTDTERKQAELKKMEQQEQREMEFQFSLLGDANKAVKPAAGTNASTTGQAQVNALENLQVSGLSPSLEEQAAQQQFYVSFT